MNANWKSFDEDYFLCLISFVLQCFLHMIRDLIWSDRLISEMIKATIKNHTANIKLAKTDSFMMHEISNHVKSVASLKSNEFRIEFFQRDLQKELNNMNNWIFLFSR